MKYVVKIDKTLFHYFTFSPFWQKVPSYVIVLVIDSLKVFRTLDKMDNWEYETFYFLSF